MSTPASMLDPRDTPLTREGRLSSWARRRPHLLAGLIILAGLANNAWSLRWGFQYDDYFHQFALRGLAPDCRPAPWDLYNFTPSVSGGYPHAPYRFHVWWLADDFKIRFFRPISSLSIWIDHHLHGDSPVGYHLTSLTLFGLFLGVSYTLYRSLGTPSPACLWALAVLALSPVHCVPVGWIANRNTVLAGIFSAATVLCVVRYRISGRTTTLILAALCQLLACGSKESGMVGLFLATVYVFIEEREAHPTIRALGRVASSRVLWALLAVTAIYAALYFALGYGARSLVYPTPWGSPRECLLRLPVLFCAALLSLSYGTSADLLTANPHWVLPVLAIGPVILGVSGVILFRAIGKTRLSLFALGWTFCCLLLEMGADISDRLLVNTLVGFALLLGMLFQRAFPIRESLARREYARLGLAIAIVIPTVILAIPLTALRCTVFGGMAFADRKYITNAEVNRSAPSPRSVFLLNTPSSLVALSMSATWAVEKHDTDTWVFPIQMGRRPLRITREGPRTLILTSKTAPFIDHRLERLFITTHTRFTKGATYKAPPFTAEAIAVEPAGIRTLRLQFEKDLDTSSYDFLAWRDDRLASFRMPKTGQTLELPEAPALSPFAP